MKKKIKKIMKKIITMFNKIFHFMVKAKPKIDKIEEKVGGIDE